MKLVLMTTRETIFMGLLGLVAGIAAALPIILYYADNPIRLGGEMAEAYEVYGIEPLMGFSTDPGIIFNQFLGVLVMMLLTLVYPLLKIGKLNIINALRA
jgi:ABC-type antimicrobial peptide transport system permease subunit